MDFKAVLHEGLARAEEQELDQYLDEIFDELSQYEWVVDPDYIEEEELDEKRTAASVAKKSRALKRSARKGKAKRKLARKKAATPEKLRNKARKAAKKTLRDKFSKGKFDQLSFQAKDKIDDRVKKAETKVNALSKKLLPIVKKKDREKVKAARGGSKKESFSNDHIMAIVEDVLGEK